MPVTARLSRKFYETLGDDIANELVEWFNQVDATYRADLRDLNELNFGRFDAKLAHRFAESDARLERRLAETDSKWERRFAALDSKWERRFAELDSKWERGFAELDSKWERRFAELDSKWERRFAELDSKWEHRLAVTNETITQVEARLMTALHDFKAELLKWMFGTIFAAWVTLLGAMIALVKLG